MSMHTKKKGESGFTMIEMLAVIAIIGILASIAIPNLSGARERARDSERVTEVSQIALAVELYYGSCKTYPTEPLTTGATSATCPAGVTFGTFMPSIPTGPLGEIYDYATNGSSFVVRAELEQGNSALGNDLDGTVLTLDCSDGTPPYFCKGG